MMARDPWAQRHDDAKREDEDYLVQTERDKAARTREHLEVLADALAAPGSSAPIGFDPADGGKLVTAPVRWYQCVEHPQQRVASLPKKVTDHHGLVVGFHYPIADGPFCLLCARMMRRTHGEVVDDAGA
jgi:hypothetical protein